MDALHALIERERICRLKARYFRFYDTQDWAAWLALLTPDATLHAEYGPSAPDAPPPLMLPDRAAIADYIVPRAPLRRTVHHGHTPEIDLLSPTEARGIWAMEDIIDYADRRLHGYGHYHERYRQEDGAWRIAAIRLTRLRLVTAPLPTPAGNP